MVGMPSDNANGRGYFVERSSETDDVNGVGSYGVCRSWGMKTLTLLSQGSCAARPLHPWPPPGVPLKLRKAYLAKENFPIDRECDYDFIYLFLRPSILRKESFGRKKWYCTF